MKYLILLFVFSISFFAQTSLAGSKSSSDKKTSQTKLKISQIKTQKPVKGIFTTQGFVAKIFVCPPCPPNTPCKPCMKNNIVVSESNIYLDNYNLSEKEMIIFMKNPKKLVIGKKYTFKIKVTEKKSTSQSINDVEIVSYKGI